MADHCREVITEHALWSRSGDMLIRCDDPEIEAICPLNEWIQTSLRFGRKVYRRRIIVVGDWEEVTSLAPPRIIGIAGTRPCDSAEE